MNQKQPMSSVLEKKNSACPVKENMLDILESLNVEFILDFAAIKLVR